MRYLSLLLFLIIAIAQLSAQEFKSITVGEYSTTIKDKRLALVIGNCKYNYLSKLHSPSFDAQAMKLALQACGFEVIYLEDGTKESIETSIDVFSKKLKSYDVGLIYYSGHGAEIDGITYLVPVDLTSNASLTDVKYKCVVTNWAMEKMAESGEVNKTCILVLDACRDNPFLDITKSTKVDCWSKPNNTPSGSIICFAASNGEQANQGKSLSPYTELLLKHMKTPGLNLEGVFKKVRIDLTEMRKTNPKLNMVPVEENKLTTEFYFVPAREGTNPVPETKPVDNKTTNAKLKISVNSIGILKVDGQNRGQIQKDDILILDLAAGEYLLQFIPENGSPLTRKVSLSDGQSKVESFEVTPKDSDADGVIDDMDDCPELAGLSYYKGCPKWIHQINNNKIMPGLSLAGIDIGMDINTVLMILGNESRRVNSEEEINFGLVYEHKADAFLGIYFYEGKVSEISIMTMMCEDNGILPIKIRTVNEDIFRLSKQDVESIYGTGFYKSQDISLSVRKECNGKKENTTIYDYLSGIEFTFNEKSQYVKRVIVKRNLIPWVLIPAGNFDMGCNSKNESCKSDEIPLHPVNLNSYYIGKYEVTQALWTKVMGTNPSSNKNCENCPVENVNQYDIQEFLIKLNKKTGLNYRLPTEAEWEYAARGGNLSRVFNKYAGSNSLGAVAWHFGNSGNKTHPVGLKQANELGIHDMSGNVWEWCSDYYNENYYRKSPQKNPKGPSNGSEFIIRGGSFYGSDDFLFRSTNRRTANPNSRYANGGFRLAHDSF